MSPADEWVRDWYPWDSYRSIHESYLRRHHFVVDDELTWFEFPDETGALQSIVLAGQIQCHSDVVVRVQKSLQVQYDLHGRPQVLGDRYVYHAYMPGERGTLRYDNAHTDTPDEFHRHEYDLITGVEKSRSLISRAEMPRLSVFLDEVAEMVGFGV